MVFMLLMFIKPQKIATLNKTVRELRHQFATANQEIDNLNNTINSLRADLRSHDESSCASISTDAYVPLLNFHSHQATE